MSSEISEYIFITQEFTRGVVPGSARSSDEPGLSGTISFEDRPATDTDRNYGLAQWLQLNAALLPTRSNYRIADNWHQDTTAYVYFDGEKLCSLSLFEQSKRNNRSNTDPLKYRKFAIVRVQPIGELPEVLTTTLTRFGYEESDKCLTELLKPYL